MDKDLRRHNWKLMPSKRKRADIGSPKGEKEVMLEAYVPTSPMSLAQKRQKEENLKVRRRKESHRDSTSLVSLHRLTPL